jgi:hypothetical protein
MSAAPELLVIGSLGPAEAAAAMVETVAAS